MCFWGAMAIFPIFCNGRHQLCVSVNTQKTGDPNFRGVGNRKFCSRMRFWGAMAIFPIFPNGRHQFCISVNIQKTGDPNFTGVGNWNFALGCIFGELWPFFPFSVMADTNFVFRQHSENQRPKLYGVGNWKFCSRMRFWGATAIFPIFRNG